MKSKSCASRKSTSQAATNESQKFSSFKWITTRIDESGRKLLVNRDDVDPIFNTLGAKPCNIISIFGRARQGKSFLMNCLANEKEIFRVSNEKDSCTQGIDISNKWLNLSDFSTIDGGERAVGKAKIGFIDAEGQGDKNVTYDATLVCPILLVSKCVIFNWKGDLQKDLILETLGIMTKAAKNVNNSDEKKKSNSSSKVFSHLHIVFRDWQSVNTDSNDVYQALFRLEETPESSTRDRIRKEIENSFESVEVWLFEAPTDSVRALQSKLTIDKTTPTFRHQIRQLRNALSRQLSEPTYFAGHALTGKNMSPTVLQIAETLNSGESLMPNSAFVNMLRLECDALRLQTERNLFECKNEVLNSISGIDSDDDSDQCEMIEILAENDAIERFMILSEDIIQQFVLDRDEIVGEDGQNSELSRQVFHDSMKLVLQYRDNLKEEFILGYKNLFTQWLLKAKEKVEDFVSEKFRVLNEQLDAMNEVIEDGMLEEKVNKIFIAGKELLCAGLHGNAEMADAIKQLSRFCEIHAVELRRMNQLKHEEIQRKALRLVEKGAEEMEAYIPEALATLVREKVTGFTLDVMEEFLNIKLSEISSSLQKEAEREGISSYSEEITAAFHQRCSSLQENIIQRRSLLLEHAIQRTLLEAEGSIQREISELITMIPNTFVDDSSADRLLRWAESTANEIFNANGMKIEDRLIGWGMTEDEILEKIGSSLTILATSHMSRVLNCVNEEVRLRIVKYDQMRAIEEQARQERIRQEAFEEEMRQRRLQEESDHLEFLASSKNNEETDHIPGAKRHRTTELMKEGTKRCSMLPSESTIEEQKRKAIEFFSKQNVNVQAKSNKRGKAQSKAVPVTKLTASEQAEAARQWAANNNINMETVNGEGCDDVPFDESDRREAMDVDTTDENRNNQTGRRRSSKGTSSKKDVKKDSNPIDLVAAAKAKAAAAQKERLEARIAAVKNGNLKK